MKEFIDMAVSQLGISEPSATSAASGVLGLIQDQAGEGEFRRLADAVPGLDDVLNAGSGGGGGLGGLMGAASGMLGGRAGAALGLASVMQSAGLSAEQVGSFVPMLLKFLETKAGAGVVSSVLARVPELQKLLR